MHMKHLAFGLALVTAAPTLVATAQAEDGNFVPLLTYRTGPYSGSGIPVANGIADYLTMLNERDGGISGSKLVVEECVSSRISPATLCIPSAHPTPGAPGGLFQMHGVGAACRIAASIWA